MRAWELHRVDNTEYEPDDIGIYVLINWDIETDTVRLDFMSRKHEPIQSFAGSSDNVRKYAMRYIHEISRVNWPNSGYDISLEHAAYIGSELEKADTMRIGYVQDGTKAEKIVEKYNKECDKRDRTALIRIETGLMGRDNAGCSWYEGIGFDGLDELRAANTALTDSELIEKTERENKTKAEKIVEKYNKQMLEQQQYDFMTIFDATRFVEFERKIYSTIALACSSIYYLHECPETKIVSLCEAGVDNNIVELLNITEFQNWLNSDIRFQ